MVAQRILTGYWSRLIDLEHRYLRKDEFYSVLRYQRVIHVNFFRELDS